MDDLERISEVISVRLARGEMPGANFPAEWWPIVGKALRDHISLRANHDKLLAAMADGTGRQFYIDGAQAALDVANSVRIHASWGPKATPDDGLTLGIDGVKDKVRRFVAGLTNADKQMSPHRERFATFIPRAGVEALEAMLRSLLQGEHTSLTLGFNDGNACNYLPVGKYLETYGESAESHTDWVSDEERAKAIATNSWWCAQWYPRTPVGFQSISAASLPALVAALAEEAPAIEAGTAETAGLGPKAESAVTEGEAPVNSVLLSALKAMDAALTWHCPSGPEVAKREEILSHMQCEAWIQIRSAITQAEPQDHTPSRS